MSSKLKMKKRQRASAGCKLSTLNFQLLTLLAVALFFAMPLKAQVKIGDNSTPPKSFSVLELSTAKVKGGLRLPLLTKTERDALVAGLTGNDAAAAKGLVIYNTDDKCMQYWNGTKWVSFLKN